MSLMCNSVITISGHAFLPRFQTAIAQPSQAVIEPDWLVSPAVQHSERPRHRQRSAAKSARSSDSDVGGVTGLPASSAATADEVRLCR